jgi:hypothetical protein
VRDRVNETEIGRKRKDPGVRGNIPTAQIKELDAWRT